MYTNGENRKPKRKKKNLSRCHFSNTALTVHGFDPGLRRDSLANHRMGPITELRLRLS
jgi:hypothetical protein